MGYNVLVQDWPFVQVILGETLRGKSFTFKDRYVLNMLLTSSQGEERGRKYLEAKFQCSAVCHILNAIAFLDLSIHRVNYE